MKNIKIIALLLCLGALSQVQASQESKENKNASSFENSQEESFDFDGVTDEKTFKKILDLALHKDAFYASMLSWVIQQEREIQALEERKSKLEVSLAHIEQAQGIDELRALMLPHTKNRLAEIQRKLEEFGDLPEFKESVLAKQQAWHEKQNVMALEFYKRGVYGIPFVREHAYATQILVRALRAAGREEEAWQFLSSQEASSQKKQESKS